MSWPHTAIFKSKNVQWCLNLRMSLLTTILSYDQLQPQNFASTCDQRFKLQTGKKAGEGGEFELLLVNHWSAKRLLLCSYFAPAVREYGFGKRLWTAGHCLVQYCAVLYCCWVFWHFWVFLIFNVWFLLFAFWLPFLKQRDFLFWMNTVCTGFLQHGFVLWGYVSVLWWVLQCVVVAEIQLHLGNNNLEIKMKEAEWKSKWVVAIQTVEIRGRSADTGANGD